MIWVWLAWLLYKIKWLAVLPADPKTIQRIDPNARCPVCGAEDGTIRLMPIYNKTGELRPKTMVVHTCNVCKCSCGEDPISVPKYPIDLTGEQPTYLLP